MKERFIKSTIILIIGGGITKILGMVIRICMTRLAGLEGISLYMLVNPTFSLFMTMSQFSLPNSVAKVVAEDKYNNKKLVLGAIPLTLVLNIMLIIIIILAAPFITTYLLKDPRCYLPILAIALVLPFDAISSVIRGYFFGKQKMLPHVLSNILEQIVRLTLILWITPSLMKTSITNAVTWFIMVNVFSESLSITILYFFLPKKIKIEKEDFIPQKEEVKDLLQISIPTTTGRLISSLSYFLEPIILTLCLTKAGYKNEFITTEYGVITGYALPMLALPNFFTGAISSALLPVLTKEYARKNKKELKKKLQLGIFFSLLIGIPVTILLVTVPTLFLKLIYHTSHGANYLRILAPIFLLSYIEAPLGTLLQATNRASKLMVYNLCGVILKTMTLFLTCFLKIGLYPLIIALSANILLTTFLHLREAKKILT